MKQTLFILMMAALFFSCSNNNSSNVEDAKQLAAGIKQMQPGGIATTKGGWTMTAKIGANDWVATSILSPETAGRIAGDNDGVAIALPYDRKGMLVGSKTTFSHNNAVDLFTQDEVGLWGGYAGEMEITKADAEWAEGKFFFTGSSDDKKIEVTDGFFRISMAQKK